MKYITHNQDEIDIEGTYRVGTITHDGSLGDKIRAAFGEPDEQGEWLIKFEDGTVAALYDLHEVLLGQGHYAVAVGGHNGYAMDAVTNALGMPIIEGESV